MPDGKETILNNRQGTKGDKMTDDQMTRTVTLRFKPKGACVGCAAYREGECNMPKPRMCESADRKDGQYGSWVVVNTEE
jgi:hypothetical protein